jgi:hypothetical protein
MGLLRRAFFIGGGFDCSALGTSCVRATSEGEQDRRGQGAEQKEACEIRREERRRRR